ncbi:MAG: IPTL-CTERM sorting domain-containing protein [bacterium]|nr:IPTL-CTERM sorting domain-containing protein [bacterium]
MKPAMERSSVALACALLGLVLAVPAAGEGADSDLGFEPRDFPELAGPPLPDPAVFPVQLVLDDDGAEGVFGFGGANARQFLWLNSFASPGPIFLEEIWVLFPAGMDVPVGGDVQLAVYVDPDGDPTTGAQLLAYYDEIIQVADGDTFSVYPLATPLQIDQPGDVLIGVVNRFFETGVDPPPSRPAALDTTLDQGRSYFALWIGDADDPPDLAGSDVIALEPGNFMIRAFGRSAPAVEIPTLGDTGLAVLAVILGLVGVAAARRRA